MYLSVSFNFSLPSINQVEINVYDINGTHLETLINETKTAGNHNVTWNAENHPTGIYFIQFISEETTKTMKAMLIK